MKIETGTIVRTVLLVVALINQFLSISGKAVLPIDDAQIEMLLSTVITMAIELINWWKNNSFTGPAIEGDKIMKGLKEEAKWTE